MISKEDFNKVWKDSAREAILNQYYYDYMELQKVYSIIKEVREYAQEKANEVDLDLKDEELTYVERHNFENEKSKYIHILEILEKGK